MPNSQDRWDAAERDYKAERDMSLISHLSKESLRFSIRMDEARRDLLDYAPPGSTLHPEWDRALAAHLEAGFSPADAAEQVQAKLWKATPR